MRTLSSALVADNPNFIEPREDRMSSAPARIALACVLTIGIAGVARAQSSQANDNAQDKRRKTGNQVPDSV